VRGERGVKGVGVRHKGNYGLDVKAENSAEQNMRSLKCGLNTCFLRHQLLDSGGLYKAYQKHVITL
jgi:hypothetical protein